MRDLAPQLSGELPVAIRSITSRLSIRVQPDPIDEEQRRQCRVPLADQLRLVKPEKRLRDLERFPSSRLKQHDAGTARGRGPEVPREHSTQPVITETRLRWQRTRETCL